MGCGGSKGGDGGHAKLKTTEGTLCFLFQAPPSLEQWVKKEGAPVWGGGWETHAPGQREGARLCPASRAEGRPARSAGTSGCMWGPCRGWAKLSSGACVHQERVIMCPLE